MPYQQPNYSVRNIIAKHWDIFKLTHSSELRSYQSEAIDKMIRCGDHSKGFFVYYCDDCDEHYTTHYRCNSRACNRCGKFYADEWAEKVGKKVFNKVHRHMTFTVPADLRPILKDRWDLIKVMSDSVCGTIKRVMLKSINHSLTPAIVTVIHPFGNDIKFHPHIHSLVAEGGLNDKNGWRDITYFHHELLRKIWQDILLTNLTKVIVREPYSLERLNLLSSMYDQYPNGFVVDYGGGRKRIKSKKGVARYIGRYLRHLAISDRRIEHYDGKNITFWYEDKKDVKHYVTLPVEEFIKRLIQHIPPKHFKMVRYYGLYNRKDVKKNRFKMKQETIYDTIKRVNYSKHAIRCPKCRKWLEPIEYIPAYSDTGPPKKEVFGEKLADWIR